MPRCAPPRTRGIKVNSEDSLNHTHSHTPSRDRAPPEAASANSSWAELSGVSLASTARPPPSPLDSLATLSPLKEPTEGAGVAAPEARRPPPSKRSPPPPSAAPWPFFRHPAYEYRAPRVSAWASSYGTTYGATAPAWTPMPVSPTLTNLTSLYRRRVQAIQSRAFIDHCFR